MSDSAFWILYYIWTHRAEGEPCTQKDICDFWLYSPQTVNSTLKKLESKGLVTLTQLPTNRKHKLIELTETGGALAMRVIYPLMVAEQTAFDELTEEEQSIYTLITEKYADALKKQVGQIQTIEQRI